MMRTGLLVGGVLAALFAQGCAEQTNTVDDVGRVEASLSGPSTLVRDWNLVTLQVAAPPPTVARSWALVHLAMFDAVNSIEQRYEPYAVDEAAPAGASVEAAAVQAAYRVLVRRYPAALATLDAARANSLAAIADGPAKDDGIALGDSVGNQIFDLRAADLINAPGPAYVFGTGPAAYQATPPAFAAPVNTGAQSWVPFAMTSASQFRPEGPPAVTSRLFARDYNETKTYGTACPDPTHCARSPEQSQTALWHSERGELQFNRIARNLMPGQGFGLLDEARVFALLNLALIDSTVAAFDAKYQYNFVRPVTAIRNGDADGNDRTVGDSAFNTFMPTPPHPEYPAAHTTVQGAAAVVLNRLLGDDVGFDDTTPAVPGVTRHFANFDAFTADGFMARIYGGMHYRNSLRAGRETGRAVGRFIAHNMLTKRNHCDH